MYGVKRIGETAALRVRNTRERERVRETFRDVILVGRTDETSLPSTLALPKTACSDPSVLLQFSSFRPRLRLYEYEVLLKRVHDSRDDESLLYF